MDGELGAEAELPVVSADLDPRLGGAVADERAEVGRTERPQGGDEVERLEDVGLADPVGAMQHGEAGAEVEVTGGEVAELAETEVLQQHAPEKPQVQLVKGTCSCTSGCEMRKSRPRQGDVQNPLGKKSGSNEADEEGSKAYRHVVFLDILAMVHRGLGRHSLFSLLS
ncbi:hypothetical protein OV079_37525 [Nannocystis pusilla]|uniref:Uncharacterized protein n=1 Tax=Nannocystis pusilla TaxID=889268 RepID=A0A9X3EVP5_9BACT|nr:hypothetical protein [Nannocystis pusilla]MCY1011164.1 hypothetical protein [Nannocystis pusilla]